MKCGQDEISWTGAGKTIRLGLDCLGQGPRVLMLPALSSISTRCEMRPLQERLADAFTTVAIDWPGFGNRPRPPLAYAAFLDHILTAVAPRPHATIAAGHGAGYLLAKAAQAPGAAGRLALIAPTWRDPLSTMSGKRHPAFARIGQAVDWLMLGPLLYKLNVNRPVGGRHDGARARLYRPGLAHTRQRLAEKRAVIDAPGARHASIRFVTGSLDPLLSRDAFIQTAEAVRDPMLVVYGADTPRKSQAEMAALANVANVRAVRLDRGKLAVHEEFPDAVAAVLGDFLLAEGPGA